MAEPVAELFADLGFKVDQAALAAVDAGLVEITAIAQRAVNAVGGLTAAFAKMGVTAKIAVGGGATAAAAAATGVGVPLASKPKPQASGGHGAPAGGEKPHVTSSERGATHGGWRGLGGILENFGHIEHAFLGAFAVHEVMHFAHGLMDMASANEKAALKLGITTAAVQEMGHAANMVDIDMGTVTQGLKFLQLNAQKASEGSKEQAKVFRDLGVSVKGLNGEIKPADALFEEVATKVAATEDPAKRTALAMRIFGRSGVELLPILVKGGAGIAELREEARMLGGVMGEETAEKAAALEENVKRLAFAFNGVKYAIGNGLLPILTRIAMAFTSFVGKVNEAYKRTKIFQTLIAVGLTAGFVKLIGVLRAVGSAGVLSWLKTLGGYILLAAAVAGVVLIFEDLYQTISGGKGMIGQWIDEWKGFGTTAEFAKTFAAGLKSIREEIERITKTPLTALKALGIGAGRFFSGADVEGEYYTGPDGQKHWRAKAKQSLGDKADERANRPVANGRGMAADARGSIDIPRASERGLHGKADRAFGQAQRGGVVGEANSDSVVVNIHAPGADGKDIAKHVKHELEKHEERRVKKIRHALVPASAGE